MDGGSVEAKRDFTLRQLGTFVTAARAGSFARAADQLGVSQPAISGCIAILEKRLNRRLFSRRPGGTPILTPDGHELLEMAETLLSASDAIRADERPNSRRNRRVRLCIGPLLRDAYLKPMLPILYRERPDIELDLVPIIPIDEVRSELEKGRVDLVVYTIGRLPARWPNATVVCQVPTVLIAPPGTAASLASGAVRIDDLPFILPGTTRLSEHWIERQLGQLGIKPRKAVTYLDFPDVIAEMVAQGLGVSVLMREQVEPAICAGRVEVLGFELPPMERVVARSPLAGSAACLVADYLAEAFARKNLAGEPLQA